ncbi:MAG: SlyX family protein [Panacagrimonas sp.]
MDDPRIIDLQTRIAFQEDTLRALDEVIQRQQDQLERIQRSLVALSERMRRIAAEQPANSAADEVPPHY